MFARLFEMAGFAGLSEARLKAVIQQFTKGQNSSVFAITFNRLAGLFAKAMFV